MGRRRLVITLLPCVLAVAGCSAGEGDPADATRLAKVFCRAGLGIDQKVQPERFASCMRRILPSATAYSDCLAGAGEFAVESEMDDCEMEAGWSPY